jgi:hypothetical protein
MHAPDAELLRNALDIACGSGASAPAGRVSLTPGSRGTKVGVDALREAGFGLATADGTVVAIRPDDGLPRFAPGEDERLALAYRFALAGTDGAPDPGMGRLPTLPILHPHARPGRTVGKEAARTPRWPPALAA